MENIIKQIELYFVGQLKNLSFAQSAQSWQIVFFNFLKTNYVVSGKHFTFYTLSSLKI